MKFYFFQHRLEWALIVCGILLTACGPGIPDLAEGLAEAEQRRAGGDIPGALQELDALLQHYGDDRSLLETLAFVHAEAGNHAMAAFYFNELAQGPEGMSEYSLMAAQSLIEGEDLIGAIDAYESYLQNHPEDSAAHASLAALLQQQGRLTDALVPALESYRLLPSASQAIQLGNLYLEVENLPQARQWYRIAEERDEGQRAEALLGQLQVHLRSRRFSEARELIRTLDQEFPGRLDVSPVAHARTQLDQWEQRRAELQRETERIAPTREPVPTTAARIRSQDTTLQPNPTPDAPDQSAAKETSDDAASVAAVADSIAAPTTTPTAQSTVNTEPTSEVAETTDPSWTIAPALPEAEAEDKMSAVIKRENALQNADSAEDKPESPPGDQAATSATSATNTSAADEPAPVSTEPEPSTATPPPAPPSPQDIFLAAQNAAADGDHAKARELLRSFLKERPEDAAAWSALSDAHFALQEFEWSETTALEAIRRDRENVLYTLQFLKAAQKTMEPPQFLNELRKARRNFPNYPDITLAVARGYRTIARNYRNAAALYEEFLRQAPDHPQAGQAREELATVRP